MPGAIHRLRYHVSYIRHMFRSIFNKNARKAKHRQIMLSRLLPGLLWLQHYKRATLKSDVLSGISVAFMLIPQGMAYAVVAGLPPEYGLYACIIPPMIYALLGSSNKISIGPVALDSILIITGLSLLAEPGTDRYLSLAISLTLMVGLIQVFFGAIKFGFITNFLSWPVIIGYTSAAALIIMASQLEGLLGVAVQSNNIFALCYQLIMEAANWHHLTLIIGLMGVLFMLYSKHIVSWLPSALTLMLVTMLLSGLWDFQTQGVAVINHVPQGLPNMVMPALSLADIQALLPVALTVALMGYVGSMSICKSLEKPTDKISAKPNQELLAVGFANLLGAFFKAFPVSASFSRSAAFRAAGALTQVSAVVSSIFIAITLLFFTPLFEQYPLPRATLSAIIIVSVAGLFKHRDMRHLFQQNRREFVILMATFFITLLLGVQQGLLVGVVLSIAMVIYNSAKPHMTELGLIGGLYRNTTRFKEAAVRKDVLIFRFDATLYFANKDYFAERLYSWVKQRPAKQLKHVIFDAEAVNSIDTTALLMLQQVIENFRQQNIDFYISNPIGPVRDCIKKSSLQSFMCEQRIFSTIDDALTYIDSGINVRPKEALQTNE